MEDLVKYAASKKIFVVLDFHRYHELSINPDHETKRFLSIWSQMSRHYKGLPSTIAFEVINEPRLNLEPARYNSLLATAINIIREHNPNRLIIADTPWVAHYKGLSSLKIPNDLNVVPSFHFYDPMEFTHQQASWMDKYKSARDYNEDDINKLSDAVKFVTNYISSSRSVPFVGEFGAINKANPETRKAYMTLIAEAFASIGVQTCAWTWDPDRQAFPIQHGTDILPGLESALIKPR
ncbi:hypothetical protein AYR46_01615 [Sphingobium yanoikuyae]|nr:hypothetical protein AYR46_01615 [Sphingobium yanoikuyae]